MKHVLDKSISANVNYFNKLIAELNPMLRWRISIVEFTETRSEKQNALSHSWYGDMVKALNDNDALGYKCYCKLHFGVPIMRAEDEEFRNVYDMVIKGLDYAKKLEIMKILPVTSLMNTKQLTQYLDAVKAHFYETRGLDLKYPMDFYADKAK